MLAKFVCRGGAAGSRPRAGREAGEEKGRGEKRMITVGNADVEQKTVVMEIRDNLVRRVETRRGRTHRLLRGNCSTN